jgi:hypothetical protein
VDPFLNRLFKRDKQGILDVKALTKSGRVINIEVQICRLPAIRQRVLYYLARLIGEQLRSGDRYERIQPVIVILICGHVIREEGGSGEDLNDFSGPVWGGKGRGSYLNSFSLRNDADGKSPLRLNLFFHYTFMEIYR